MPFRRRTCSRQPFKFRRRYGRPRDLDPVRVARLLREAIVELEREQRRAAH